MLENDGSEYNLVWTPRGTSAVSFTIIANDSRGAVSEHEPLVRLCGCALQNGAECVEVDTDGGQDGFILEGCECGPGMYFVQVFVQARKEHVFFQVGQEIFVTLTKTDASTRAARLVRTAQMFRLPEWERIARIVLSGVKSTELNATVTLPAFFSLFH